MGTNSRESRPSRGNDVVDRVLSTVAEEEGCDPLDLLPLTEAVDPDALARLGEEPGVREISFRYHGYTVSVDGDGGVSVTSAER